MENKSVPIFPLLIYALTRNDGIAGNGTWDDLPVKNGEAARAALFGSGQATDGMLSWVHIGGKPALGENPYPSINTILGKLGIGSSAVDPHHHHFHIYLRPPERLDIPQNLLADTSVTAAADTMAPASAQDLVDYALTLVEGGELMFTMDIPYVPAQETPIVLAQADAASPPPPDYIMTKCQGTASAQEFDGTALRGIDPGYALVIALNQAAGKRIVTDLSAIKNITLLETTKHGRLVEQKDNEGLISYYYDPVPNYVGEDRAVFTAEYNSKHYKIVVNLKVSMGLDNDLCPGIPYKLEKVTKPSSGASGYSNDFNLGTISVTFADLPGSAVGQTVGSTITLDDNAAGYNWFIDTTPADNSEYLPTSNPYEWVAKEGSDAYGKMDMLSVLLHEYGHALGIEHSADNHDE